MAFLPLESQDFDVEVAGPLAEVTVHQRFSNPSAGFVDATYLFPLDPEAVVDRMVLHVGDRVIRSSVAGRAEAREQFAAAAERGQVAALLSEQASSLFAQEVSNIPPWSSVEIELSLIQPVKRVAEGWELVVPLVSPPRLETRGLYVGADELAERSLDPLRARLGVPVDLRVAVHATTDLAALGSPTHPVDAALRGRDGRVALWGADADRDFVLRWAEAPRAAPAFSLVLGEEAAMLEVSPPELALPDLVGREVLCVVAPGLGRDAAILASDALSTARASLRDGDVLATAPTLGDALARPRDPHRLRTLLLLGTTASREEARHLAELAGQRDTSTVVVGLGPVPDRDLVEALATAGGGTAVFLAAGDGEFARAQAVARALAPPILTDVRVDWADCPAEEPSPSRLPDLRDGEPARLFARVPACFGPVWVSATSNGRRAEWAVWPEPSEGPRALAVAWARARVAELERQERIGERQDVSAEVRAIGLAWGVVTRETSLVAVDAEIRNVTGEREGVAQPLAGDAVHPPTSAHPEWLDEEGIEEVVVEAAQQAVETSSTTRAQVLSKDFLTSVPTGRSFQTSVTLARGVAAGASHENTYLLDGANVTDPVTGTSSLNFHFDALQQVEVLLAGYQPEYGGVSPIVNLVSVSGTNNLEAEVAVRHQQRVDDGEASLRGDGASASASGPLLRDRVWLVGTYGFDHTRLTDPARPSSDREFSGHEAFGKVTAQPTPEHRFAAEVAGDTASVVQLGDEVDQAAARGAATWQWFASPEVAFQARASSGRVAVAGDLRDSQLASASLGWTSVDDPLGGVHDLKVGVEAQSAAWSFESDLVSAWLGVPVPESDQARWGDAFVQDSWKPVSNLTINGGLRLDVALGDALPGPRLYAAWDPWGDQKTKLVGGYGRRYGLLSLPVTVIEPEEGLTRLDEALATAEREVLEDVAIGLDATLLRYEGLPVRGGGRTDRTSLTLSARLRKVESRRWFSELAWTRAQLIEAEDVTLLVGEVGPDLFGHHGTATVGWSLPTDPWTQTVAAVGEIFTEPLVDVAADPALGVLPSVPRWTAGASFSQAIDARKGQVLLRLDLRWLGLVGVAPPSTPLPVLQAPWLVEEAWAGPRVEGALSYAF